MFHMRGGVIMFLYDSILPAKFFGSILRLKNYEGSIIEHVGHSVATVFFMSSDERLTPSTPLVSIIDFF